MDDGRDDLLRKISALDFYIIDLGLYLNTHPNDKEALTKYNESVRQVNSLKRNLRNPTECCSRTAAKPTPVAVDRGSVAVAEVI